MSNQATGEYYRMLNAKLNDRLHSWDNGEIVIISVNFGNIEYFIRNERWDDAQAYLANKACKHRTAEHVECREQHDRGVGFVVLRGILDIAATHWQHRLRAL